MAKLISATMALTLAEMSERGGELVRWAGGFWTYPNCTWTRKNWPHGQRIPDWYVGTHTVNALLRRGEIVATEKSTAWGGTVRVRLSEANMASLTASTRDEVSS